MELFIGKERHVLLSNGITEIVMELIKTNKIDGIFMSTRLNSEQDDILDITLSVMYDRALTSMENETLRNLIDELSNKMGIKVLTNYRDTYNYGLLDLYNKPGMTLYQNKPVYYPLCLGELLYDRTDKYKYLQEISRRNSNTTTTINIMPALDIKRRLLTRPEGKMAS